MYVPALDDGGYLECIDGRWDWGLEWVPGLVLPPQSDPTYCPSYCLADLDADPAVFELACSVYAMSPEEGIELPYAPDCEIAGGIWEPPAGEVCCLGISTGVGGVPPPSSACTERGLNADFAFVGDCTELVPPSYELYVNCAYDPAPSASCPPPAFLPDDPVEQCE